MKPNILTLIIEPTPIPNQTVLPLHLNHDMKFNVELISIIKDARTAGVIVATLTAGYLSDKIGRRLIVIVGMLIEGMSLYIYTIISRFELFILTGLIASLGEGMVFVCLIVLLTEVNVLLLAIMRKKKEAKS